MKAGFLIIAHGSRDPGWVRLVDEAVRQANWTAIARNVRLCEDAADAERREEAGNPSLETNEVYEGNANIPFEVSFLEIVEGRFIQDGIDRLEAQGVTDLFVIPFFVSSGSTHVDEIACALGAKEAPDAPTDLPPFRVDANVHFGQPMDGDPDLLASIIVDKARALSVHAEREEILIVAHGSDLPLFRARWEEGLRRVAARVAERGGFAAAGYALLLPDQVGEKARLWKENAVLAPIVMPLFLSSGYFTGHVIPERLQGAAYRYDGNALLPHPLIPRWIERQAAALLNNL